MGKSVSRGSYEWNTQAFIFLLERVLLHLVAFGAQSQRKKATTNCPNSNLRSFRSNHQAFSNMLKKKTVHFLLLFLKRKIILFTVPGKFTSKVVTNYKQIWSLHPLVRYKKHKIAGILGSWFSNKYEKRLSKWKYAFRTKAFNSEKTI